MKRKPRRHADHPPMPGPQRGFRSRPATSANPESAHRPERGQAQRHRAAPGRGGGPDAPAAAAVSQSRAGREPSPAQRGGGPGWIYGTHAVLAALANPARRISRIVVATETQADLAPRIAAQEAVRAERLPPVQALPRDELERLLPRGSVHQGIAVQASELEPLDIDDLLRLIADRPRARLVALDQVTDPHNVGAILRSAAAFGVDAVILPERHAPAATAVMAKTASGALDKVPLVRVVNLSRALDSLKAANVWCIGLAGSAQQTIGEADLTGRVALVLGSEGEGLRRLTRERCDLLVRIPMHGGGVESLNVSNAAAIALYETSRGTRPGG